MLSGPSTACSPRSLLLKGSHLVLFNILVPTNRDAMLTMSDIPILLNEFSIITGRHYKHITPKHESHDCIYSITQVKCWTYPRQCVPLSIRTEIKLTAYHNVCTFSLQPCKEHHTLIRTSSLLYPSSI